MHTLTSTYTHIHTHWLSIGDDLCSYFLLFLDQLLCFSLTSVSIFLALSFNSLFSLFHDPSLNIVFYFLDLGLFLQAILNVCFTISMAVLLSSTFTEVRLTLLLLHGCKTLICSYVRAYNWLVVSCPVYFPPLLPMHAGIGFRHCNLEWEKHVKEVNELLI